MVQFLQTFFDNETEAKQAAEIGEAVLAARSLHPTESAVKMPRRPDAAYRRNQRFLQGVDPREVLWCLFREEVPFVLGDVTEVKRPQPCKTEYVGTLKDGKTRGFWLLLLATPYRGRAVPCAFLTRSSRTIAARDGSRSQNHFRGIEQVGELLGERPLVMDREFSYLELLQYLIAARVHFIIRLPLASHPPKFTDANGQKVVRSISRGQKLIYRGLRYSTQKPGRNLEEGAGRAAVGNDRPGPRARVGNLPPPDEDRRDFPRLEPTVRPPAPDEQAPGGYAEDGGLAAAGVCGRIVRGREAARPLLRGAHHHLRRGPQERAQGGQGAPQASTEMETLLRPVRVTQTETHAFPCAMASACRWSTPILPGDGAGPCPNSGLNLGLKT
ncbi:MAG: hypothetical protein QXQ66_09330 [Candidatus Hadarchaeum sp.]|uniref:hypothetical protein n=1 Tax=Candidatus Hadarchaeum sp. TaxID=2883567 RepID=UPI003177F780